jgi:hypothetical protein
METALMLDVAWDPRLECEKDSVMDCHLERTMGALLALSMAAKWAPRWDYRKVAHLDSRWAYCLAGSWDPMTDGWLACQSDPLMATLMAGEWDQE